MNEAERKRMAALEAVAEAARAVGGHINLGRRIHGWWRLGTALHALDTLPAKPVVGGTEKNVDALLAENARLRSALEAITASDPLLNGNPSAFGYYAARRMQEQARAALKETTP